MKYLFALASLTLLSACNIVIDNTDDDEDDQAWVVVEKNADDDFVVQLQANDELVLLEYPDELAYNSLSKAHINQYTSVENAYVLYENLYDVDAKPNAAYEVEEQSGDIYVYHSIGYSHDSPIYEIDLTYDASIKHQYVTKFSTTGDSAGSYPTVDCRLNTNETVHVYDCLVSGSKDLYIVETDELPAAPKELVHHDYEFTKAFANAMFEKMSLR